jgi:hypothetical protein
VSDPEDLWLSSKVVTLSSKVAYCFTLLSIFLQAVLSWPRQFDWSSQIVLLNMNKLVIYERCCCSALTAKQKPCKFLGKFPSNGRWFCGIHYKGNASANGPITEITEKTKCSICFKKLFKTEITMLNCSHHFHTHCLRLWKETPNGKSCPLCRRHTNEKRNNKFLHNHNLLKLDLLIGGETKTFFIKSTSL